MTRGPGTQKPARTVLIIAAIGIVGVCAGGALSLILKGFFRDFEQFYWAAVAMRDGADLYSGRSGGYLYPPLTAFALVPLAAQPLKPAALVWLAVNASLLVSSAWLAAGAAARVAGLRVSRWGTLGVAVCGTLIVADKARSCLDQGQSDLVMVLALVLGLRWLGRRDWATGGVLGLAANIKYASLAALPYLLLRRRWRAAAWMAGWTVALALLPAVHRGWDRNLADLGIAMGKLSQIAGTDAAGGQLALTARHRSVSIPSAVTRWTTSDVNSADGSGVPGGAGRAPVNLIVAAIALVITLIAAGIYRLRHVPLFRTRADPINEESSLFAPRVVALEWSGLIVAVLAFSPHTEGRHMVLLLPVTCLAVALLGAAGPAGRRVPLAIGLLALWLGLTLPPGGETFRGAVETWRSVAGPSWCMLLMYFAMLWTGLRRPEECAPRPRA